MFTIAGKRIEVCELTWKEYKALMKLVGSDLVAKRDQIKQMLKDDKGVDSWLEELPEIITRALSLALRVQPEEIDKATATELLNIIPEVIKVNRLAENIQKAKNLRGLLGLPTQPALDLDPKAEAAKMEKHLKGLKKRK